MIKAVLFDIGSTLIEPNPDIAGVFFEMAGKRGHVIDHKDISCHMPAVNDFYEQEYLRDGDFWCSPEGSTEMYLDMYRYLSILTGLAHDAEGMAQAVHAAFRSPDYWRLYRDVIPVLKTLRKSHVRLGVVSNWDSNLHSLLRGLMMAPYFDEIVSSAEVGYRKPNPMIFTIVLERMALAPQEVVHVGDRPDADGVGARGAGVTPIIIDRADELGTCEFLRVSSLVELPKMLERFSA